MKGRKRWEAKQAILSFGKKKCCVFPLIPSPCLGNINNIEPLLQKVLKSPLIWDWRTINSCTKHCCISHANRFRQFLPCSSPFIILVNLKSPLFYFCGNSWIILFYFLLCSYFIILTNITNSTSWAVLVIIHHSSEKVQKGINLRFITNSSVWVKGTAAPTDHFSLSYYC